MRALMGVAIVVAVTGCAAPAEREEPVAPLDRAMFDARVEPILEARCATPACHGQPERGLVVYAPLQYRADAARTWVLEPLTASELRYNFEAAVVSARLAAWSGGSMLLKKPLADRASEFHGGGAIFGGEEDRDWRTLRDWVQPP